MLAYVAGSNWQQRKAGLDTSCSNAMLAAPLLIYFVRRAAGDTRNNADGTNSSECELRRDVRDDRACAQRLPFLVEWNSGQPIHVA